MPVDQNLSAPTVSPADLLQPDTLTQPGSPNVAHVQTGGIAGGTLKIAQDLMAMHQAKQNHALQEFQRNMSAAAAGVPVNPNALVKLLKKAGVQVATRPEDLQSLIAMGQGVPAGPQKTGNPQAPSQQGAPQGGPLTRQQLQQYAVHSLGEQILQTAKAKGESIQKMADLQNLVTKLKFDATSNDAATRQQAVGKLMSLGEIPFNLSQVEWENATPEGREAIVNIATGHASEAQLQTQADSLMNTFLSSGKFTDPEMASKAATAIVHGQPIPPDVKAAMKPYTFTELVQQADLLDKLVQIGVPDSRLQSTLDAASLGGLAHALPPGLNSVISRQLALREKEIQTEQMRTAGELAIEGERLGLEKARYAEAAAKADAARKKEENEAFFKSFQALVDLKRAGGYVPPDLEESYTEQLADRSNMQVTESKHLWQYITGGHYLKFSPKPASDLANAAAGKPSTQPSEGVLQKLYKTYKKAKSSINEIRGGESQ
jgi:hypothetical protein